MAQVNIERNNAANLIDAHIAGLPEPKRTDIRVLHQFITGTLSEGNLWFSDGKSNEGRTVTNPTMGYGSHTMRYADGKTAEWFRIGLCATRGGISVYVLGIPDKNYLASNFGNRMGKAKLTGYCISFKALKDIDVDVLKEAVRYGLSL